MLLLKVKTKKDIQILVKLAEKIWKPYWTKMLGIKQAEYMYEKFQSASAVEKQIEQGYIYKIITEKTAPLGYYGIVNEKDYLYISKLYVDTSQRGKGLGKIMLQDIIKTAKKHKQQKICLNVNKDNSDSIKIYERLGFKIIESVVIEIGSGYVMDDYIMELPL